MPIATTINVGDHVKVFFDNALWVEGNVLFKPPLGPSGIGVPWIIQSAAALHLVVSFTRISKETPTPVTP
jgi:hypothetical protein